MLWCTFTLSALQAFVCVCVLVLAQTCIAINLEHLCSGFKVVYDTQGVNINKCFYVHLL